MRKSEDDIYQTLHHCCIHSHTKTYLDKGKAASRVAEKHPAHGNRPGQGPDKGPDEATKLFGEQGGDTPCQRTARRTRGRRIRKRGHKLWPVSFFIFPLRKDPAENCLGKNKHCIYPPCNKTWKWTAPKTQIQGKLYCYTNGSCNTPLTQCLCTAAWAIAQCTNPESTDPCLK